MNRFKYSSPAFQRNESNLGSENNVTLYDGDQKTSFEAGEVVVTTHRLLWGRPGAIPQGLTCLTLDLALVVNFQEESSSTFSFYRSRKLVLHLSEPPDSQEERPQATSIYNYVKLSIKDGTNSNFNSILRTAITLRKRETRTPHVVKLRTGIVGIERTLQAKHKAIDERISIAFQDLHKLMTMAKDMVRVSNTISNKIREKKGGITEDETVRFKSYLLSLGIDDPVTRDAYKSDNQFYRSLSKQICESLLPHIEEMGGMMALTDVFCRVNRARGLELLSPDDILSACQIMESLDLPLKLYEFTSGVKVLQLTSLDDESVAEATAVLLEDKGCLSSEELAQILGISITLAKERLLSAERYGKSCRDDSIEGLKFYPNLFMTQ